MTSCVNEMQRGRTIPSATKLKTFMPDRNAGAVQQAMWSIEPTALAKPYCDSKDCKDQITITAGMNCGFAGDDGDTIVYNYDGSKGEALIRSIICAISQALTLNNQGVWAIDGANLSYRSKFPGLNLNLSIKADPSHFVVKKVAEIAAAKPGSVSLVHGTVAHSLIPSLSGDCGAPGASSMSGRPTATLPTQDPRSATAEQAYAGIVVHSTNGVRGHASGVFPFFGDCNDCCPPPESCVEIANCCAQVDLLLEGEMPSKAGSKLYYRIAPAGAFTHLGRFSFTPGPGLIEFPQAFSIIDRNGPYLIAQIH